MKPYIIFDTDMDTDCDDVGALSLIIQYVKQGKANLLGIINDAPCIGGAPVCQMICDYYGIDVPIGAIYEKEYGYDETERYHKYRNHRKTLPDHIYYNRQFATMMNKTDEDYPASALVYRQILADAPDHSVTIMAVGFMTAIEALWNTPCDQYSDLNGYDLFKLKVKEVVSMGCADYPETDNYNFNYNMDGYGAQVFFEKCPCSIYVSPDGEDIITGSTFTKVLPENHPMRMAYEIYNGKNTGRMSWDLVAALYTLEDSKYFRKESHGMVCYNSDINHVKWIEGNRTDYQIKVDIDHKEMADLLESILVG